QKRLISGKFFDSKKSLQGKPSDFSSHVNLTSAQLIRVNFLYHLSYTFLLQKIMGCLIMEFCSECGTMLVPGKDKKSLTCPDCGAKKRLDSEKDYKLMEENKDKKAPGVAVVEGEEEKRIEEPKYDIDTDVKAEIFEETY
ncbi:hypothetical protein AKJ51_04835, partial [candidate division MSBL1 archaeon SCGC-AAA382A20]